MVHVENETKMPQECVGSPFEFSFLPLILNDTFLAMFITNKDPSILYRLLTPQTVKFSFCLQDCMIVHKLTHHAQDHAWKDE